MKYVDIRKKEKVNPKYFGINDPLMPIYHSTAEFRKAMDDKVYTVINNISDFQKFVTERNMLNGEWYFNDEYIFLATGEKYIPDRVTPDGVKIYLFDENYKPIQTDNCYIRLYILLTQKTGSTFIVYTSSGIFKLSIGKFDVTAAEKSTYVKVTDVKGERNISYAERLEKLMKSKRTYVKDVRLFNALFNPFSDYFMDVDAAVKKVYGGEIKKRDREKIVKSERFRNIIINELGKIMPGLQKAIHDSADPQMLAERIIKVMNDTIDNEKESVDNKLKAWTAVASLAHPDEITQSLEGSPQSSIPFLSAGRQQISQGQSNFQMPFGLEPYNEEDFEKREKADKEQQEKQEEEVKMDEEELKKRREEVNSIHGYTQEEE